MTPDEAHTVLTAHFRDGGDSAVREAWHVLNGAMRRAEVPHAWRRLTSAECGRRARRSSSNWSSAWKEGSAPEPDGFDETGRPWWLATTLDDYTPGRWRRDRQKRDAG